MRALGHAVVVVVVALATVASAAPSVRVRAPTGRAHLDSGSIELDTTQRFVRISFTIHRTHPGEVEVPLDLPSGARVVELDLQDRRLTGQLRPVEDADREFRVNSGWGDATGEVTTSSGGVRLHAFVRFELTVDLLVELPAVGAVVIEKGALGDVFAIVDGAAADVRTARKFELSADSWMFADPIPRQAVDDGHALVAGAPKLEPFTFRCACPKVERTLDRSEIWQVVKLRMGALAHCYELALQREPSRSGRFTLTLEIAPAGTVEAIIPEDEPGHDEVGQCIVREARTWRFRETDATTKVSWPVTFRVAGSSSTTSP